MNLKHAVAIVALAIMPQSSAHAVGTGPFETPWEYGVYCDGVEIWTDSYCCGLETGAICVPGDTRPDLLLQFISECEAAGGVMWQQPLHFCQWGPQPYPLPAPDCPTEDC